MCFSVNLFVFFENTYFAEHPQTAAFGIFLLNYNDVKKQRSNYKISEATTGGILQKVVRKNCNTRLFTLLK